MSGRFKPQTAYGFMVKSFFGDFEISWVVDRYYASSLLRHPKRYRRITDLDGARRFCRRHNFKMPDTT